MLPPNPTALKYNPNGELNDQQPIPYQPAGGLGTNGTEPVYRVQSDFDYQSVLLGLYQEWIELDLFYNILATLSEEESTAAGLTPSDRFLIEFMADQESGHATLLSNLLEDQEEQHRNAHITTPSPPSTKRSTSRRNLHDSENPASGVSKHI